MGHLKGSWPALLFPRDLAAAFVRPVKYDILVKGLLCESPDTCLWHVAVRHQWSILVRIRCDNPNPSILHGDGATQTVRSWSQDFPAESCKETHAMQQFLAAGVDQDFPASDSSTLWTRDALDILRLRSDD